MCFQGGFLTKRAISSLCALWRVEIPLRFWSLWLSYATTPPQNLRNMAGMWKFIQKIMKLLSIPKTIKSHLMANQVNFQSYCLIRLRSTANSGKLDEIQAIFWRLKQNVLIYSSIKPKCSITVFGQIFMCNIFILHGIVLEQ